MKRTIFYLITNLRNGRGYVGKTCRGLEWRWREHTRKANSPLHYHYMPITRAIAKHGPKLFCIEQIASSIDDAGFGEVERVLIEQFETLAPRGYNVSKGGEGAMRGRRHSPATIAKMSASQTRRQLGGENNPFFGKKHSPETLALFSKQRRGKARHSQERKAEMSKLYSGEGNPYFGRKHSAEIRAKLSKSHKGKKHTAESRLKISEAMRRYRAEHG
jgi:group I intron endonuclease